MGRMGVRNRILQDFGLGAAILQLRSPGTWEQLRVHPHPWGRLPHMVRPHSMPQYPVFDVIPHRYVPFDAFTTFFWRMQ